MSCSTPMTQTLCLTLAAALCLAPQSHATVTASGDIDPNTNPATWGSDDVFIGFTGTGTLDITGGSILSLTGRNYIGFLAGSQGTATVTGNGSQWEIDSLLNVGNSGTGTLNISDGGHASTTSNGNIGLNAGSQGDATVTGAGSWLEIGNDLFVGFVDTGTLDITNGGLVSVDGTLTIDWNGGGDSFINMATGGMLALQGDAADSLASFYDLIDGTDAINYWDETLNAGTGGWAPLIGATPGEDYTLTAYTSQHLIGNFDANGYTVLTVGVVPEPTSLALLSIGGLLAARRRRGKIRSDFAGLAMKPS